jgi:hypothetical protein
MKSIFKKTDPMPFTLVSGIGECARCKHKNPYWGVDTKFDHGYLPAFTADLKQVVLLPVENDVWYETVEEGDDLCVRVSLCPSQHLNFFDRVSALTLDHAVENQRWYRNSHMPCAQCGWETSYFSGNEQPPKRWDLVIKYGPQEQWKHLSGIARTAIMEKLLQDYKEWWNWTNRQTGERVKPGLMLRRKSR